MMYSDGSRIVDRVTEWIIAFCLGLLICLFSTNYYNKRNSSPVERDNVIDSLTRVNDNTKIKVKQLDSIKNAKVIEVSTLGNDSTIKLFHELVSE